MLLLRLRLVVYFACGFKGLENVGCTHRNAHVGSDLLISVVKSLCAAAQYATVGHWNMELFTLVQQIEACWLPKIWSFTRTVRMHIYSHYITFSTGIEIGSMAWAWVFLAGPIISNHSSTTSISEFDMWLLHLVLVPQLCHEAILQVHYWQTVNMVLWL